MLNWRTRRTGPRRSWHPVGPPVTTLASSPGPRRPGAAAGADGVGAVDVDAVITEAGVADDESWEAMGSQVMTPNKAATAKTAPAASREARHRIRSLVP